MHDGWKILCLLSLAGCEEQAGITWLGFPEDTEAKSMLIATRDADIAVEAIDLTNADHNFSMNIRLGDAPPYRTVHAMLYDTTLGRLGYDEGPLSRGANAAEGEFLALPDRGVFASTVDQDTTSVTWQREAGLPDDIREFRVREPSECATFGPPASQHVLDGRVLYAIALDDTVVLVRSQSEVFLLSIDGRTDLDNSLLKQSTSAYLTPDGALYIGDSFGRIWRGTASTTKGVEDTQLVAETGSSSIGTMDGGTTADGEDEVLFVTYGAEIGRLNQTNVTSLGFSAENIRWPIVWTAPGHGFIAQQGIDMLAVVEGDSFSTKRIGAESQIMSLARHPDLGVVAGTAEGHFYAYHGETEWGRVVGADFGWWAVASAPYEDGFVFLLASGFFGQYKRARGFCESLPVLQILEAGQLVSVGRDVVVIAVPDERPTTTVIYQPRL